MRISILIFASILACAVAEKKNTTVTKLFPAKKSGKPGENREKKSLYNFGNFGYNHQSFGRNNYQAQRRIANYHQDYYQQDPYQGHFNGPPNSYVPDASNHIADHQPPYYHQPQYIEPPEPIIEIIIKESNESLPEPPVHPHFIKKKKKEQVQVFYVNYKKGQNNKLQLENPIPALTPVGFNNDQHEEEEEEIIHPVTPLPKLKTTTIRTIIHPESEKFHSNSGIHVSFNVEDKYQSGHQLQENNEGSEIRPVVALPHPQVPPNHHADYQNQRQNHEIQQNHQNFANHQNHRPHPNHQSGSHHKNHQSHSPFQSQLPQNHQYNHRQQNHFRGDYSRAQQSFNSNYRTQSFQSQPTHLHPLPNNFQQSNSPTSQQLGFRGFAQPSNQNNFRQNGFNSHQQVTHLTPRSPPFIPQQTTSQFQLPYQHSAPQFNRPPPPQKGPSQPLLPKPHTYFPDDGPKTNIKSHVNYQPLNKQPEQSSQHRPIPIPLHSVSPDNQHSFTRPLPFGPPSPTPAPQFIHNQPENTISPHPRFRPKPPQFDSGVNTNLQYNKNPQIQSNPPQSSIFSTHLQQNKFFQSGPAGTFNGFNQQQNHEPNHQQNHHLSQQQTHQQNHEQTHQQNHQPIHQETHQQHHHQQQNHRVNQQQSQQQNQHQEGSIQNINVPFLGNIKSELVKSVPRFEQHITETVGGSPTPFGQSYNGVQQQAYKEFTSQGSNAIQTVPSPNLGPTTPASDLQHHSSTASIGFSSTPSQNYNHFEPNDHYNFGVSSLSSVFPGPSSTPNSLFTPESHEKLQIVTPVPALQNVNYNHHQSLTSFDQNRVQPQIIPNSQPLPQKLPAPGQSVSTIHTEALKEIERLKQNYLAQKNQFNSQPIPGYSHYNQHTDPNLTQQSTASSYSHFSSGPGFDRQQNNQHNHQPLVQISSRNQFPSHQSSTPFAQNHRYHSTISSTPSSTTTTTTTEAPTTTTTESSKPKPNIALPDEVPEDLRQQLLSSGILDHADISVLDYDKVGDTALENLPPEHLAHFYGAGGASQISGSSKVVSVVKPNGEKIGATEKLSSKYKEAQSLPKRENVDLKVVRFDPINQKSITDKYIRPDATVLPAVDLNNSKYNRYLPLKINGAQFPIPDAYELRGKRVSSVVVLAPVDPLQESEDSGASDSYDSRQERGLKDSKRIKFIAGESLKTLLKKPTKENFKRWLEKESRTDLDFQSVVLLVTKNKNGEQEIFMYDISSKEINKLSGALSTAFVNVAEENASSQDIDNAPITDSGIVETMSADRKEDYVAEASDRRDSIVKFSSKIQSRLDGELKPVYINSGYSVIKN